MSRSRSLRPLSRVSAYTMFVAGAALFTACGGDAATAPSSSTSSTSGSGGSTQQTTPANPLVGIAGCDAAVSMAQLTSNSAIQFLSGFGNAQNDAAFWAEVSRQSQFWGSSVPASVYIMNEGSPTYANAWASPDGYILFGYWFFNKHLQQHGGLAIDGTLAHEWGHRAQQTFRWSTAVPTTELEADAFSGYYLALAKQRSAAEVQGYYQHFASIGDYNFNSSLHHGTPRQRVAAAYLGVLVGVQAMQTRQSFSYAQLHQYFAQQISQQILPNRYLGTEGGTTAAPSLSRTPLPGEIRVHDVRDVAEGRSMGAEVNYPSLTTEELQALRPH